MSHVTCQFIKFPMLHVSVAYFSEYHMSIFLFNMLHVGIFIPMSCVTKDHVALSNIKRQKNKHIAMSILGVNIH